MAKETHNINKDLLPLKYPIDNLKFLPGNSRQGHVDSVAASLKEYQQMKPIVVRREENGDEIVLAGNTTLRAARLLGWTHVAVTWADDYSDTKAIGFAVTDNHTSDLGHTDDELLVKQLEQIREDEDVWKASSFTDDDLDITSYDDDAIDLGDWEPQGGNDTPRPVVGEDDEEDDVDDTPAKPRPPGNPVIQYAIVFDDEEQQQRWFAFIRQLKTTYPDLDTVAARLDEHIQSFTEG